MKRVLGIVFIAVIQLLSLVGAGAQQTEAPIFQWSTITALLRGVYDGQATFRDLKQHGDFGMGTLNGLDGEMVASDGEFYQIKADGKAYPIQDSEKTPFAVVLFFKPYKKLTLKGVRDLSELEKSLDAQISNLDLPHAIRIEGKFRHARVRSVPRQQRPYPDLNTALRGQKIFESNDIEGTLVGFRFPTYMAGVNVPGYHFHFITRDKKAGGHVLGCDLESGEAELASSSALNLKLTESAGASAP
ncbi:MAG: acetolactate decarboxylase [Desulfomonile tiedjei]|nr:acetolactate decarboxylase [Desulfomonile tiedjei]